MKQNMCIISEANLLVDYKLVDDIFMSFCLKHQYKRLHVREQMIKINQTYNLSLV